MLFQKLLWKAFLQTEAPAGMPVFSHVPAVAKGADEQFETEGRHTTRNSADALTAISADSAWANV